MHLKAVSALLAAVATALMALGVSTATARNFSINNQQMRATFNDVFLEAAGVEDHCRVTLEGSLHERTISKTPSILVGYITRVIAGQCSVGTTLLTETLPWHVRYVGFSGRLPDITLVLFRSRGAFRVLTCAVNEEFNARISRDPATGRLVLVQIPLNTANITGVFCPATGRFSSVGNGETFQLGTTNRLTVTLI